MQGETHHENFRLAHRRLGLAAGAAAPAFAADSPKNKAECEKSHMKWDATAKKCSK